MLLTAVHPCTKIVQCNINAAWLFAAPRLLVQQSPQAVLVARCIAYCITDEDTASAS